MYSLCKINLSLQIYRESESDGIKAQRCDI